MMPHAPLVSVIVPVYNAGRLLSACLESLAAQTYTRLEIVVVNDGATDESSSIARSFADAHPRSFRLVEIAHAGRAAARQAGVEAARGEFLGFADADDLTEPSMYERLVEAALTDSDVDVVVCRYQNFTGDDERGHIYEEGSAGLFGGRLIEHPQLLTEVEASLCNKLFRRDLFDLVEFPVGKDFEDLAATYRLLGAARRIVRVDSPPLYLYRQAGPVSVMSAYDRRYQDILHAIDVTCDYFRQRGEFQLLEPHLLKLALRHVIFGRFGSFFDRGGTRIVWPYLDRAYALLDRQFDGWRESEVLRQMCGSAYSRMLVQHRFLMKAFVAWRSFSA